MVDLKKIELEKQKHSKAPACSAHALFLSNIFVNYK